MLQQSAQSALTAEPKGMGGPEEGGFDWPFQAGQVVEAASQQVPKSVEVADA